MFGVVLWSDQSDLSAVIWCEDHQDLAIIRDPGMQDGARVMPEAGDLVAFEIEENNGIRLATNAVIVATDHAPGLSAALRDAVSGATPHRTDDATECVQPAGEVVPFPVYATARHAGRAAVRRARTGTGH